MTVRHKKKSLKKKIEVGVKFNNGWLVRLTFHWIVPETWHASLNLHFLPPKSRTSVAKPHHLLRLLLRLFLFIFKLNRKQVVKTVKKKQTQTHTGLTNAPATLIPHAAS